MTGASRQRGVRVMWLSMCALCLLMTVPQLVKATIDYNNPTIVGDAHIYTWFTSATTTNSAPAEGTSGVGLFCRPGVSISYDVSVDEVVFSDACQSTSTVRQLTQDGYLGVLAGSLSATTGYVNGTKDEARFGGISIGMPTGTALINGIIYQNGYYYLADTSNNAIRRIAPDGTTITFINTENGFNGEPLRDPTFLANYVNNATGTIIGFFISDTGGSRILQVSPPDTTLASRINSLSSQPRVLTATANAIYFVGSNSGIYRVSNTQQGAAVLISDLTCLTYVNSLVVNADETALYFLASVDDDSTVNIYSVSLASGTDPSTCPQPLFAWPFSDRLQVMAQRLDNSWILMSSSNVYAAGMTALTPIVPTTTSTTTSSPDTTTTTTTTFPPTTTTTTEAPPIYTGRTHGVAAFPRDALPTNSSCLMSQLYAWMRYDAQIAYATTDFYTQFMPLNDTSMAFYGDINVSDQCGNIVARRSNDETIEILDFWGPKDYERWYVQSKLADSPWTWTRRFLDGLHRDDLGPFCFYNCTDACQTSTANPKMCVDYQSCDDVCKGAIASSVVMGVTGIVLIILMIVSPANLFTALVMVPII